MIPLGADLGVGLVPYSPQGKGRLTRPRDVTTDRSAVDEVAKAFDADADGPIIDAVEQVAAEHEVSMAQIAVAWVLRSPVVSAPIVGATTRRAPGARSAPRGGGRRRRSAPRRARPRRRRGGGEDTPTGVSAAPLSGPREALRQDEISTEIGSRNSTAGQTEMIPHAAGPRGGCTTGLRGTKKPRRTGASSVGDTGLEPMTSSV
jgi:hypothetical protein